MCLRSLRLPLTPHSVLRLPPDAAPGHSASAASRHVRCACLRLVVSASNADRFCCPVMPCSKFPSTTQMEREASALKREIGILTEDIK